MNFGEVIKNEILSKLPKEVHCKKAFLSGLIRGTAVLYEIDGEYGLEFKTTEQTVEVIGLMLKSLFNYDIREVSVDFDHLNKKDVILVNLFGKGASRIFSELGILSKTEDGVSVGYDSNSTITEKECCFKSYVRGLFISAGACTVPKNGVDKTGYRAELCFSHYVTATQMANRLSDYGINSFVTRRRDNFILYIKSSESIKDFLAFLQAPISVLKITDIMINREMLNNVNRQKNCDLGNVNRQVEASAKQVSAIEKIRKAGEFKNLKPDLKETATARLNYPEDTLTELAERLNVSKSCLNHRLRKLVCIANETEG